VQLADHDDKDPNKKSNKVGEEAVNPRRPERMTMDSYWARRPWPSDIYLTIHFQAQTKYLKGLFI
jgi:hypothetical protein